MLNISEPIKARRRELGMTQEQLAQQLGVSGPAVSKWEQGASYPDVTLLPALARALHTDLNTLMGFRRMPEKAEITQMLARVNDVVREQGVDAGVALAKEILREYPDCGALLFGLAATIDGRMMMAGMTAQERAAYSGQTGEWYVRAAQSEDAEAREAAAHLLGSYALGRGDTETAQKMLERLPQESKTARWTLEASLLMAQGEREKARTLLQRLLFARAGDIQQMLLRLEQAELEEGNLDRAKKLADLTQGFGELMRMHPYTGHMALLLPALAEKDAGSSLVHLKRMLAALEEPWSPGECLPYDHAKIQRSGQAGRGMLGGVIRELENSAEYDFLREDAAFQALIKEYGENG